MKVFITSRQDWEEFDILGVWSSMELARASLTELVAGFREYPSTTDSPTLVFKPPSEQGGADYCVEVFELDKAATD